MREEIQKALEVLRGGGVILYPTDTVWGIGCDATNPEAVARVYAIKKREDSKSLVLLASDMDMICRYVKEVPEMAVQLVEVNDKPMTIIYPDAVAGPAPADGVMPQPCRTCLAFNTVAEDGTVGIRIPMMDFCQQLVSRLGRPLVSTSAKPSGILSRRYIACEITVRAWSSRCAESKPLYKGTMTSKTYASMSFLMSLYVFICLVEKNVCQCCECCSCDRAHNRNPAVAPAAVALSLDREDCVCKAWCKVTGRVDGIACSSTE